MKLIPTEHFKKRMVERGISWAECEATVRQPTGKETIGKGVNGGIRHRFTKKFADKTVVVVVGEHLPKSENIQAVSVWKQEG